MQKQAPTFGRILAMVLFALSCFGILMYLWVSFGGPTPLRAEGYRFKVQMPESALLVNEAPVRMAGLDVGRVKSKSLEKQGGQLVEVEMNRDFAPIPKDSSVTLRQKSLLGQIYIEITPGSKDVEDLPDGGRLPPANVQETVDFDELISTFDKPTRDNYRGWIKELAKAIEKGIVSPDAQLSALVEAASKATGLATNDVIKWFGIKSLPLLSKDYPRFFSPYRDTRSFLLTLNDIAHAPGGVREAGELLEQVAHPTAEA